MGIVNLGIFQAQILSKCIGSRYLVSETFIQFYADLFDIVQVFFVMV